MYEERKLVPANPFVTVDRAGVGRLMQIAVRGGPGGEPRAAPRHLRRARRRPRERGVLPRARAGLRQLLAVPRRDRAARRRAGGGRGVRLGDGVGSGRDRGRAARPARHERAHPAGRRVGPRRRTRRARRRSAAHARAGRGALAVAASQRRRRVVPVRRHAAGASAGRRRNDPRANAGPRCRSSPRCCRTGSRSSSSRRRACRRGTRSRPARSRERRCARSTSSTLSGGAHVAEPPAESFDPEPEVELVIRWESEADAGRPGELDEQRLTFRSAWLAWKAARRFRELIG